jgi:hypothetical protein
MGMFDWAGTGLKIGGTIATLLGQPEIGIPMTMAGGAAKGGSSGGMGGALKGGATSGVQSAFQQAIPGLGNWLKGTPATGPMTGLGPTGNPFTIPGKPASSFGGS